MAVRKGASVVDLWNEKNCKGCICMTCYNSAINGALFVCNKNSCSSCNDSNGYSKRQYCNAYVPHKEEHADDIRI